MSQGIVPDRLTKNDPLRYWTTSASPKTVQTEGCGCATVSLSSDYASRHSVSKYRARTRVAVRVICARSRLPSVPCKYVSHSQTINRALPMPSRRLGFKHVHWCEFDAHSATT